MKSKLRSTVAAPIVIAFLLLAAVAYVGAYFNLPKRIHNSNYSEPGEVLVFKHRWQADLFRPASNVEAWLTNREIRVVVPYKWLGVVDGF